MALRRVLLVLLVTTGVAAADPIRMRFPEGPTHGFVALSDMGGRLLAHGELLQWLEGAVVASQLVIRFDDGSLYDEIVRFLQHPVFRVVAYQLVQRGPSFTESLDAEFDRTGRYRVRRRESPDAEEEHATGRIDDMPVDVSNGMSSTLLRNLRPGESATTHFVVFRPKPFILEMRLQPDGQDDYWVGALRQQATRYRLTPRVPGALGVAASVLGKQPPEVRMWMAQSRVPTLVLFEGPIYAGGPSWRVVPAGPEWKR